MSAIALLRCERQEISGFLFSELRRIAKERTPMVKKAKKSPDFEWPNL
jgi:hypothetical protein